jgi:hypothetical protein
MPGGRLVMHLLHQVQCLRLSFYSDSRLAGDSYLVLSDGGRRSMQLDVGPVCYAHLLAVVCINQ